MVAVGSLTFQNVRDACAAFSTTATRWHPDTRGLHCFQERAAHVSQNRKARVPQLQPHLTVCWHSAIAERLKMDGRARNTCAASRFARGFNQ